MTGKYNDGIPEGSRFSHAGFSKAQHYDTAFGPDNVEKTLKTLRGLKGIADELGCSMAQLAIAWTMTIDDVSTVILGASSVKQLEENVASLGVVAKLTPEVLQKIEDVMGNLPDRGMIWRTMQKRKPRRVYK